MRCILSALEKYLVKSTAMGRAPASVLSGSAEGVASTVLDPDTGTVIEGNLMSSDLDTSADML